MRHHASDDFWSRFDALPEHVKELARQNFELLKLNSSHPSLHFKKVGNILDHSISLHSGYTFRTAAILREERTLWKMNGQWDQAPLIAWSSE